MRSLSRTKTYVPINCSRIGWILFLKGRQTNFLCMKNFTQFIHIFRMCETIKFDRATSLV